MNNGHSGKYFNLRRGVRQGDPLSPYIFILAIELLAVKIREDNRIQGFQAKDRHIKLALYADDLTVMVQNEEAAKALFDLLKEFEECSGLKINKGKTEGMWIGSDQFRNETPLGIKWPTGPKKILGIFVSYNVNEAIRLNFDNKVESLLKQLHWWKARNLSLKGRILIIKTLGLSKFSLLAAMINIPEDIIIKINAIIYNFIWGGKTDKVRRQIITQEYQDGGLKMLDFNHMIKSAKIKWIKRYFDGNDNDWKVLFELACRKKNLGLFLRANYCLTE